MPTTSTRLGLKQHTVGDVFRIADYAGNWALLDKYPGVYVCTTTTRPTWTTAQAGMLIQETDTGLTWRWTGSAWARLFPAGLLGRASRTSDISTSSLTLVTAHTATVTVPAGGRSVMVVVDGPGVYSTAEATRMALLRGSTTLASWLHTGSTARPAPLAYSTFDTPAAGSQTYTLQFSAETGIGGTSTIQATTTRNLDLTVVEV